MLPTPPLRSQRLTLEPLRVDHAAEMAPVLADPALYRFTGGRPPAVAELAARYRAQVAGPGVEDGAWHNWVIRLGTAAVGFVQATVSGDTADIAWVVGVPWQGQGIATDAAGVMCQWLTENGVTTTMAHIHPDNQVSGRVAAAIGFVSTGELDADGEVVWRAAPETWL